LPECENSSALRTPPAGLSMFATAFGKKPDSLSATNFQPNQLPQFSNIPFSAPIP
jgi:hypothetical protein